MFKYPPNPSPEIEARGPKEVVFKPAPSAQEAGALVSGLPVLLWREETPGQLLPPCEDPEKG